MTTEVAQKARCCELCGATGAVLVEMQPGKDGVPWYLCVRDWIEGRTSMKCGRIPARYRDDLEVIGVERGTAMTPSGQAIDWEMQKRWPKGLPKPTGKKRKAG